MAIRSKKKNAEQAGRPVTDLGSPPPTGSPSSLSVLGLHGSQDMPRSDGCLQNSLFVLQILQDLRFPVRVSIVFHAVDERPSPRAAGAAQEQRRPASRPVLRVREFLVFPTTLPDSPGYGRPGRVLLDATDIVSVQVSLSWQRVSFDTVTLSRLVEAGRSGRSCAAARAETRARRGQYALARSMLEPLAEPTRIGLSLSPNHGDIALDAPHHRRYTRFDCQISVDGLAFLSTSVTHRGCDMEEQLADASAIAQQREHESDALPPSPNLCAADTPLPASSCMPAASQNGSFAIPASHSLS